MLPQIHKRMWSVPRKHTVQWVGITKRTAGKDKDTEVDIAAIALDKHSGDLAAIPSATWAVHFNQSVPRLSSVEQGSSTSPAHRCAAKINP